MADHRADGRTGAQLRTIKCERRLLSRADGSASWTQGGTTCLVSVRGPVQSPAAAKENAEMATLEVVFRPRMGLASPREKQFELLIRHTCEAAVVAALHPRTLIQVVVQVVAGDGAVLACALNAVCAALVDAAVPLRAQFAAVSVASGGCGEAGLLMDPTAAEERAASSFATFAFSDRSSSSSQGPGTEDAAPLAVLTHGAATFPELRSMAVACGAGAQRLLAFQRLSLARAQ